MSEEVKEEVAQAVEATAEQAAAEPAKKKKKWMVLGIVAAVIVVAGIGFFVWHEQPSFCNAICHTSMDAYLESYDQEPGAGIDKYGNEVENTMAMLAVSHKMQGLTCLSCHIPAIDQQIGEAMETITGNYTVLERANGNGFALEEVSLQDLQENAHHDGSDNGALFCMRSGCHEGDRAALTAATSVLSFNPHAWQHENNACGDCHKSHRASVMYCTQCHQEAYDVMPAGWVDYQTGQSLVP